MEPLETERPLSQQVPIERLNVPHVKDHAVPFRNWPFVERFFAQNLKQLIGGASGMRQPYLILVTGAA
jgi:hypothetical protein